MIYYFIAAALIGAPMVYLFIHQEIRNSRRADCRCCGARLHRPGGTGLAGLGSGFCHRCATEILKETTRR